MKLKIKQANGTTVVELLGAIDESARPTLDELAKIVRAGPTVIQCRGISRLNSLGVKHWAEFVRTFAGRATPVFTEATFEMLAYLQIVRGFFGGGQVTSFVLPYICSICDRPTELVVDAKAFVTSKSLPQVTCSRCKTEMEPELDADSCFDALANGTMSTG